MPLEQKIGDYDPMTAGVLAVAGALNAAGGALLVANSEVLHLVVGSYMIVSGLLLLAWPCIRRIDLRRIVSRLKAKPDPIE